MEIIIRRGRRRKLESGIAYHSEDQRIGVNFCGQGHSKPKHIVTIPFRREVHPCLKKALESCSCENVVAYDLKEKKTIDTCISCP